MKPAAGRKNRDKKGSEMWEVNTFLSTFIVSIAGIHILIPVSMRIGLVDTPGGRKQHEVHTPLIGGLTIFFALALFLISSFFFPFPGFNHPALILAITLILAIGVIDDVRNLGVRLRFLLHALVALIMIHWGGVVLADLGKLVSSSPLVLGFFGVPLTVFATLGTINALNMVDGIDGLAGALSVVVFSYIAVLTYAADNSYFLLTIAVLGALTGFLVFNFPYRARQRASIFMGDAGSNLLGFIIAWLLIALSQGEKPVIAPVTALWLYAVPLIDTVSVMVRRVWLKKSPFKADRGHLHHLLVDAGFRVRQVVYMMVLLQILLAGIGVLMLRNGVPQAIGFFGFLGLFAVYLLLVSRTWRVVPLLRRFHRLLGLTVAGARSVYVGNLAPAQAELVISGLLDLVARNRKFSLHSYNCAHSGAKRVFAEIECWSVADMHALIKLLARNANEEARLEIRQLIPRNQKNDRRKQEWGPVLCRRIKCRRHSEMIPNLGSGLTYFRYPELPIRNNRS